MSALFPSTRKVSTAVQLLDEFPDEYIALIGLDLWSRLVPVDDGCQRIAIRLTIPGTQVRAKGSTFAKHSWTIWADKSSQITGLALPRPWAESRILPHPNATTPPTGTYDVEATVPPTLFEIFLSASSSSAFEFSKSSPERIEEWLSRDSIIVHHGDSYELPFFEPANGHGPSPHLLKYSVLACEPVRSGRVVAGVTRFYVVAGEWNDSIPNGSQPYISQDEIDGTSSDGGFEIDESFLANSVLGSIGDATRSSFTPQNDSIDLLNEIRPPTHSRLPSGLFNAEPLRIRLQDKPGVFEEDHVVRVRTHDLGKLGVFNGDWVTARSEHSSLSRLVRIACTDEIGPKNVPMTLFASPVLLHNLSVEVSSAEPSRILLLSTPFGSHSPPIPVAKVVTIARIASPYTIDRKFQSLFLRALKAHFDRDRRLLKKGDIFAIPINIDQLGLSQELSENTGQKEAIEAHDNLDLDLPLSSKAPTHAVYFKVTNLEYDILDTTSTRTPADAYVAATMGELGCWMDPKTTKMVQVGIEHARAPDIVDFLGLNPPILPVQDSLTSSSSFSHSSSYNKLFDIVKASLHTSAIDYDLSVSVLLKGARGIGKQTVAAWVAQKLGLHLLEINCFDVVGDTDAKTEGTLRARFDKAADCAPCIFLLRHVDALARTSQTLETGREPAITTVLQDCIASLRKAWKESGFPVLLVGTTSDPDHVPKSVLAYFKHEIAFEAPGEAERLDILNILFQSAPLSADVSIKSVATQTAALVAGDLVDLATRVHLAAMERVLKALPDSKSSDVFLAGVPLTGKDFDHALNKARASYSESIGAPSIPKVSWDDVGGLAAVKADILDTIQLPLEHPELFAEGVKKRSGILLFGPPGTGKTLLAKAVATSCSLNFFSVKGPELLNMYIGESEANVRRVFQRARDAKPCVIFFDELDSVAPKRGNHGDSGGVMDRIVSQLLAELDGMSDGKGGSDVFVIGATNRPDLLDPALLRPGRFDRMLYLGVSDTHEAQLRIIEALTRKFRLDPQLDLQDVAGQCPFNYTGADFYALCSDAMLKAMSRKAQEVDEKIAVLNKLPPSPEHPHPITPQYYLAELAVPEDTDVLVSLRDFMDALRDLVPSVSQSEMEHYARVQQQFSKPKEDRSAESKRGTSTEQHELEGPMLKPRRDKGKGRAIE